MVILCNTPYNSPSVEEQNSFDLYKPLLLSDFQKWAIKGILEKKHVFITAHTGSGKTLPAEFLIQYYTSIHKPKKKIIYTSPIKALSNQKLYDLRRKYPSISFGLLTGDCKDNPDADVLIMTTEILRNTLFHKKMQCDESNDVPLSFEMDFDTELAGVVFDEVHYLGDAERGTVWEQSILMLPKHVQMVLLSATIDKPDELADWIEKKKERDVYLIPTNHRVVPLTHYMWINTHTSTIKMAKGEKCESYIEKMHNKPILIKDKKTHFHDTNYHQIYNIKNTIEKNYSKVKRAYVLNNLVRYLKQHNMLPAICFIFSRKQVETAAREINSSLFEEGTTYAETVERECRHILQSKLVNYKEYLNLPEYKNIVSLLQKGIAIHHAGIISVLREMIELLFDKGYIRLLFATETFAVGINMPTKTVIFTSLTKYDGKDMRYLLSHEYTQMAGRAGRRGIDKFGSVIHCNNLFKQPTFADYKNIISGSPQMLTSRFKISYGLLLSLYTTGNNSKTEINAFVEKSLLQKDIQKEVYGYKLDIEEENKKYNNQKEKVDTLNTPQNILELYHDLLSANRMASKKTKKKNNREIAQLTDDNPNIKTDHEEWTILSEYKDNIE